MKKLIYFIISIRPYQWSKNLLVFAAPIFAGKLFDLQALVNSIIAFILFCLSAGSVYLINDVVDRKEDVLHPEKKNRPVAAGKLPVPLAITGAIAMIFLSITVGFKLNILLGIIILVYFLITFSYSLKLKHFVILDVIIVAIGFVLRAIAGAIAIHVSFSSWLVVCTFFLALFLVIGKRRNELMVLKDNATNHRKILEEYNPKILDQMIAVVTAASIISYALYTLDAHTVKQFHTSNLIYTIPFVVYGIFRYYYLIYKKDLGGSPEKILINDKGILLTVSLWIITVGIMIY